MSSLGFSKRIASRYLWSRRSEAFITMITYISIIGVALGVMVLNIVMGVMTGFEHELRSKIIGANSHITVRKLGGKISGWQQTSEVVARVPGVKSVSPFTYHQALLKTDGGSAGLILRGLAAGTSASSQLAGYLSPGSQIESLFQPPTVNVTDEDGQAADVRLPGIVVGRELARSYGLTQGAPVALLSPQVGSTPFGLVPKFRRFVVAGIYSSGLVEYESGLAYVPLDEAQKFFRMGDAVSGLEVQVDDIYQAPVIAKNIVEALGGFSSGLYAEEWGQSNKPLWDAMRLEKKVYFLVLLLIIVMASFSIITTLIMIVLEKRRDIAVLKTLGASTAAIANIFRIQGAVIGGIGTLLGLLSGWLGCLALREYGFPIDERIFQMSTVPVSIDWLNFLVSGTAAFVICCLATIYPARRASRMDPAELLRYE